MRKLLAISCLIVLAACQDIENCDTNDEQRFMILAFLDKETNAAKTVNFAITSGSTVLLNDPEASYSSIGLPLDPNSESVTFLFDSVGTAVSYQLKIGYETQISIFDEDCDPSITFLNLDTIRYTFDSLSIPGTVTNRQIDTNVQVFF